MPVSQGHTDRPGPGRQFPERAALPRSFRSGLRHGATTADLAPSRRLPPRLLLYFNLYRRPLRVPCSTLGRGLIRGAPAYSSRRHSPFFTVHSTRPPYSKPPSYSGLHTTVAPM